MKNIVKLTTFSFLFLCGTNLIVASEKETTMHKEAYAERLRFKMVAQSTTQSNSNEASNKSLCKPEPASNDRHYTYMQKIQEVQDIQALASSYGEDFELKTEQKNFMQQDINDSPKRIRRRNAITSKFNSQKVEQEEVSTPQISPVQEIIADKAISPQKYIHSKKLNPNEKDQISLRLHAQDYSREKFYNNLDEQFTQTIQDFQTRNVTSIRGLSESQIKEIVSSKKETEITQRLIAASKKTEREVYAQQYLQQKNNSTHETNTQRETDFMPEINSPLTRTESLNFYIIPDAQK